jgi:hypothetical protein
MAETRTIKCPNCSAPLTVPLGETETLCGYCDSQLRMIPGQEELAVVRTREEMKYRERVAVAQARMKQDLAREEADRWRQTAAKVAITALPLVGRSAGRALFDAALRRGGLRPGCLGCGCVVPFLLLTAGAVLAALLGT